jgi:hypothetical protein
MKKGEDRVRVNIRNFSVYIYEYDEEVDIIPLTVTRQVFA